MPFPFLAALPAVAGAVGSIFGKAGGDRAAGRAHEAQILTDRDRNEISKYGIAQNAQFQQGGLDLQRKGFGIDAMDQRMKQAILADLVANHQPINVSVPGIKNANISGGMRLSPENQAAFADLNKKALLHAMQGEGQFQGGNTLQAPRASELPKPGLLDKILNIGGMAGSLIGGVGGAIQDYRNSRPMAAAPYIPQTAGLDNLGPIGEQVALGGLPDFAQLNAPSLAYQYSRKPTGENFS